MKFCIDVSAAVHQRAGLGRYAQELTAALLAVDPSHEYIAFYNRPGDAILQPPLDRLAKIVNRFADKPWRLSVLLAHAFHIAQDRSFPSVDLFHGVDHLLPFFSRIPTVFTLHDLTYLLQSQTHSSPNRWFLETAMPYFLARTGAVITVSESTRRDAARYYQLDPARIHVVYEGVSRHFRPAGPAEVAALRARHNLPDHFLLFVGTIEPRKNLIALLGACELLRRRGRKTHLVLAGKTGWRSEAFFERLEMLQLKDMVTLLGYIPESDLPALYSAAQAFTFPSHYEGFGLPVLEAMACGTPVVCSNTSSLPELCGEAACLIDPTDVEALAAALEAVLSDPQLRLEMRRKGLERAATFTWEKTAQETLSIYQQVLAKS